MSRNNTSRQQKELERIVPQKVEYVDNSSETDSEHYS